MAAQKALAQLEDGVSTACSHHNGVWKLERTMNDAMVATLKTDLQNYGQEQKYCTDHVDATDDKETKGLKRKVACHVKDIAQADQATPPQYDKRTRDSHTCWHRATLRKASP